MDSDEDVEFAVRWCQTIVVLLTVAIVWLWMKV